MSLSRELSLIKERLQLQLAAHALVDAVKRVHNWYKCCEGIDFGGRKACGECDECKLEQAVKNMERILNNKKP